MRACCQLVHVTLAPTPSRVPYECRWRRPTTVDCVLYRTANTYYYYYYFYYLVEVVVVYFPLCTVGALHRGHGASSHLS